MLNVIIRERRDGEGIVLSRPAVSRRVESGCGIAGVFGYLDAVGVAQGVLPATCGGLIVDHLCRLPHGLQDGIADTSNERHDNGITDQVEAVHPVGSPIIHSSKLAQRTLPISVPRKGLLLPPHSSKRPTVWFRPPFTPDGVGNNPGTVPVMGRANVGSRYAMNFRIITERGQGSEYVAQPSIMQRCHVLQQHDAGSNHANGSHNLPEQSATGSSKSGAQTCIAQILTWETGNNAIRLNVKRRGLHIAMIGNVRPMAGQHFASSGRDLVERDSFKPASAFKSKVKRAAAAEHRKDAQLVHTRPRLMARRPSQYSRAGVPIRSAAVMRLRPARKAWRGVLLRTSR